MFKHLLFKFTIHGNPLSPDTQVGRGRVSGSLDKTSKGGS
jgi:hypothetical protein